MFKLERYPRINIVYVPGCLVVNHHQKCLLFFDAANNKIYRRFANI
jgi:hypothetical protein